MYRGYVRENADFVPYFRSATPEQELGKLPSDVVSFKVMARLKAWEPDILVPHDDHPRAGVPLYNIRGAAQGVENSWRRQEAVIEGRALLASNPRSLVDAFVLALCARKPTQLKTLPEEPETDPRGLPMQMVYLSGFAPD